MLIGGGAAWLPSLALNCYIITSPYYIGVKDRSQRASNARQESMLCSVCKRKQLKVWGVRIIGSHLERMNNLHVCIRLIGAHE